MYELAVTDHFAASHFLSGYKGKCKNLHGHTWKVQVVIRKATLNKLGMVADFQVVKKQLKEILDALDHVHLNTVGPFAKINPTTENLAKYIFDELAARCRPLKVTQVTVWESDNASVTYHR